MIAEILREDIDSVEKDGTTQEALDIIHTHDINEVAITDRNKLFYILREIDLIDQDSTQLSALQMEKENHFVYDDDHIFLGLIKMNNNDLSMIPVVNRDMEYKGAMTKDDVIDYICDSVSHRGEGGIIIIEETFRDYSLSALANIVEQESAKILNVFISTVDSNSEKVWISLKLNTLVLGNIISSLERHGYDVVAQITGEYGDNVIKERYESLMSFLNV